uniref:Class II histocompatibility antigen, B-L beta chain-like n=1 Tax=Cyanistes caeruleus TaxID=156563 RepID=A0A8C0UY78_CYACU
MGRVAVAGALLVALVVLGASSAAGAELSGVLLEMVKSECHFINGTDRVRFVKRFIYNREQFLHFDSDVGLFVGDTSFGEKVARYWNSDPEWMEYRRDAVDRHCRHNYELSTPFLVERRGEPGAERVSSGPALGMTLEPRKTSLGITPDLSPLLVPMPVASCLPRSVPELSLSLPVHPSLSHCSPRPRVSISALVALKPPSQSEHVALMTHQLPGRSAEPRLCTGLGLLLGPLPDFHPLSQVLSQWLPIQSHLFQCPPNPSPVPLNVSRALPCVSYFTSISSQCVPTLS